MILIFKRFRGGGQSGHFLGGGPILRHFQGTVGGCQLKNTLYGCCAISRYIENDMGWSLGLIPTYGFLTLHNQSSWFIKDPLSHLSPPLLSCWDPWWWSGCCNQPFAISKSMVADWEVQWENERFHRTSPALLFCRYLEKIDLAEDWRSTSFRRLALSADFHLGSFFCS